MPAPQGIEVTDRPTDRSLPRLTYLDLSGVTVTDLDVVAAPPELRVLALNPGQWEQLGEVPKDLAAAERSGYPELDAALRWADRIRGSSRSG